jgi:anti-anti-sigma regulatory factor
MPYTIETVDGKTMMKIDESLTIYDVPALHEAFVNCFESGGEITVDVGSVTECDPAGLQLLCAVRKHTRENRELFQFLGESKAIMDALNCLGLKSDDII